jgi:hypothetical protein
MSNSEPTPATARLVAEALDWVTEIQILDGVLQPVPGPECRLGRAEIDVPTGIYVVRFLAGGQVEEQLKAVEQSGRIYEVRQQKPLRFPATAPLRETALSLEYHRTAATQCLSTPPQPLAGTATDSPSVLLFVRDVEAEGAVEPWRGLSLRTRSGGALIDFDAVSPKMMSRDASKHWASCHVRVLPGAYRVRVTTRSRQFEQCVYACPNWQTNVFLLASQYGLDESDRRADLGRTAVVMTPLNQSVDLWNEADPQQAELRRTEKALLALEGGRAAPDNDWAVQMLALKYINPMLGLVGAHLLFRRQEVDSDQVAIVFENLRNLLGATQPDVLSLGWALTLRPKKEGGNNRLLPELLKAGPIETPPMLFASWEYLLQATRTYPDLIAEGSLAERIASLARAAGTWLVWRADRLPAVPPPAVGKRSAFATLNRSPSALSDLQEALQTLQGEFRGDESLADAIGSGDFAPLERTLAQVVFPLADPKLRVLMRDAELGKLFVEVYAPPKAADVVQTLRVPVGTALRTVGSLQTKLEALKKKGAG